MSLPRNSPEERLQVAILESQPFEALSALAKILRDEGMSQVALYRLCDTARAKYHGDADETIFNAILDTMDFIVGWCQPSHSLFEAHPPEDEVP